MVADSTPIDWNAVAGEVRPPGISDELWDAFWPMLTAQIGSTWADYSNTLAANASYLSTLGRNVSAVRDLFRFEVRKALGMTPRNILADSLDASVSTPGLPLRFGRVFPGNLEGRFYVGPLGYGWSHSYDIYAEELSDGSVRIHALGALIRAFHRNPDGSYSGLAGEHATLARTGGLFQLTEKDGLVYRFRNDGKFSTIQDTSGNTITAAYDGGGRLVQVSHSNGDSFALAYNAQGRLASLTDHAGRVTQFAYDGSGQHLLSVTAPGSRTTTYAYNTAAGVPGSHALQSVAFPDGTHQFYAYDSRGRLVEEQKDGSAERITYTYDSAGNMTSAADANGVIAMEYDPATDRLTRITYPSGHFFSYTYNAAGLRMRRTDQDGKQLNYEYDAVGRLARMADESNATVVTYQYDGVGRVSRKTLGNGTYATYEYDAAGQITHLVHHKADGTILSRFDYTYDALGNRTSMATLEGITSYTYDTLSQLTGVSYPDGRQVTRAYDGAGNRTVVTENGTPAAYTTNNLNQYTEVGGATYAYDTNGNLVSKTEGGQTTTYHYDFENRLVRVDTPAGSVSYAYDPLGRRIARTDGSGTVRYLSDADHVATEIDGSNAVITRYAHGAKVASISTHMPRMIQSIRLILLDCRASTT